MLNRHWKLTPRFLSQAQRATSNILIKSKIDNVAVRVSAAKFLKILVLL